jgi:LuxR family maltose regulon positive regulatory protein
MRQSPAEAVDLHRRAAQWYFTNDLPEPAMHHAVASEDPQLVIQIGERYFELKLMSGEFDLLQRWLAAIPGHWQNEYPALGLGRAAFLIFTGAFDDCSRCLDDLELTLAPVESEQARWLMARVTAVRCALACIYNDLARAETLAASALQALPAVDHATRAMIHQALGDTYRRNGHWQAARDRYLAALTLVHDSAFRIRSVHVLGALADLELHQGRLRAAAAYWAKALAGGQASDTWGKFPLPLLGWVYIRLGEIAYEWNELGRASDYLARGLERVELGGDARARLAGYVITGRLKLTAGEMAAASECLERARGVVESAPFPEWMERLERLQIEYWLAQGQLRTVVDWADRQLPAPRSVAQTDSETGHLALARVLIVIGDTSSVAKALAILQRLLPTADLEGRAAVQIEALILMALIRWRKVERADAMADLERALRLAEPEGYVRLFADLGLPVARLLQEAWSRGVMPDYTGKLLAAFSADAGLPASQEGPLPEPLTRREREILAMVAAGLTNREIAEKLVLSAETVKKHAGMIYSKLGVSNRTQAAARARTLGLLD